MFLMTYDFNEYSMTVISLLFSFVFLLSYYFSTKLISRVISSILLITFLMSALLFNFQPYLEFAEQYYFLPFLLVSIITGLVLIGVTLIKIYTIK